MMVDFQEQEAAAKHIRREIDLVVIKEIIRVYLEENLKESYDRVMKAVL